MRSLVQQPIVTQVLIGINVVVFLADIATGGTIRRAGGDVFADGALYGPNIDRLGEWWRVITAGFLHDGIFHLGLNMFALWILGRIVEPALGRLPYVLLYMASLVAGSFGALLLEPDAITVGASGAVFGLMGAVVMVQRRIGLSIWDTGIGALILLNVLISVGVSNISLGGHMGGLVGGLITGWVLTEGRSRLGAKYLPEALTLAIGLAFFFGAIAIAGRGDSPFVIG